MPQPLSQSPYVKGAANLIALIWVAIGANAMVRPRSGLEIFQFPLPASPEARNLVDNLMIIYGVRDVFMGVAMYAAVIFGTNKALGWITIAASAVAYVDGFVSIAQIGGGQWNHWGYAPVLTVVGSLLAGIAD
ncbi:uncharacterized protein Z518_03287 [Rhinocladiella mackenziei CBS 650.93]|uniref:Rhinocladiella mackenziei CBS 650.93 unplaced genomic scaffold supercont1.2, whole genome shotgun sequence n=1 Tax=Rhinocladiella mackenziei CBS 650.93 TaxID=1442369 RepID=A0A0D2JH01_9EURO|nr:uncharacterized protein Z518_03287 [Rhinocladiella mackenziei CBS 650.93]KIX08630.1 hypothetical protein Z518_03287 [Rhinocladiella mackenziei CBS 650.93]